MALRKSLVLACVLPAILSLGFACADQGAAPDPQDEAPVLAPTNVQAVLINGGDIQISWNASSQPNVRGYNVYRVDNEDDTVAQLNDAVLEVTSIVDGSARFDHEYDYRVTAVSTRNTESAYSSVTIRNREAPTDRKGDNPGEID